MALVPVKDKHKPPRTFGFYLLERYFQKYQSWPSSDGLRGLGGLIITLVNLILTAFPSMMEFSICKITFNKCLLRLQFVSLGATFIIVDTLFLRRGKYLFELIDILSDFKTFTPPKRIVTIEKIIRYALKTMNYLSYIIGFLLWYGISLEDNVCINLKWFINHRSITCDLIVPYYIPINLKPWHQAVIILFQIYSYTVILNITAGFLLLCYYMLELLILRLELVAIFIDDIRFKRNHTKNFKLRVIIMYYQDVFNLFQMTNNFITDIMVWPRISIILCGVLSSTGFLLKPNLTDFVMISISVLILYFGHHIAQRLTDTSDNVMKSIYASNWYDADLLTQKDLLIFLGISQKTFVMELPLFGRLSHLSMGNEFKKIYVWCNGIYKTSRNKNFS